MPPRVLSAARSRVQVVARQARRPCTKPSLAPSLTQGFLRSLLLKQCHQQEVSPSANTGAWQESSPAMPDQPNAGRGGEAAQGEMLAPVPPCKKRDWGRRRTHRCSSVQV